MDTQRGAVVMLQQRIAVIRNYLRDVRDGKLEKNNELLRQLATLCSRLPITADGSSAGGSSFLENANDAMLVSLRRQLLPASFLLLTAGLLIGVVPCYGDKRVRCDFRGARKVPNGARQSGPPQPAILLSVGINT